MCSYKFDPTELLKVSLKVVIKRGTQIKPIHARWINGLYNKLRNSKALIQRGFEASTITEALDPEKDLGEEDPLLHLI